MRNIPRVIFVHESKMCDEGENRIMLFPAGLISMADLLTRQGIDARILHHAVEKAADPGFSLKAYISRYRPAIVCLDLHWHQQAAAVLKLIKKIKRSFPHIYIVTGGVTASYFYRQLMKRCPEIDFLIRGDGEIPLLKLARVLIGKRRHTFEGMPNLVYRNKGGIRANRIRYTFNASIAKKLSFSNFSLLEHWELYNMPRVFEGQISKAGSPVTPGNPKIFFYPCGRGCSSNCSICSGSRISQKLISGRKKLVYIPVSSVVKDLKNIRGYGLDTWYNTFHPPGSQDYFIRLFRKIRKERLDLNLQFECLSIPTIKFIIEAQKTFKQIRLDFVLQTGSDRLRRIIKGNFYSNERLLSLFAYLRDTGIEVDLCFVAGLPKETVQDVISTLSLINFVRRVFPHVNCVAAHLEIEPGSPVFLNPGKHGVRVHRNCLNAFIKDHSKKSGLGYETECFTKTEISIIKAYYKIECGCRRESSGFLHSLRGDPFKAERMNIGSWRKFCEPCEFYLNCFKNGGMPFDGRAQN
ncbi:MAG TPA: hypothetical protein DCL35_02590 [Candidatus Omnitrophica bacterium]|nr:hypothetical protein [Candidatus Omnitrophota bacterium]